jgi:uncharacterized membrane protein HdeD (DUF308 family)
VSPEVPIITPLDPDPPPAVVVREHSGWFLALGLAQILVGTAALVMTVVATLLTVLVLGGLALAGAVVEAASVFWSRTWREGLVHVLVGLLYGVFGMMLLANPGLAASTLTLVLAVLLLANGAVRLGTALAVRFRGWGWAAAGGAVSVVLGVLVWANWPWDSLWVIGLFVGIDLLVMGWSWVALSLLVRGSHARSVSAMQAA